MIGDLTLMINHELHGNIIGNAMDVTLANRSIVQTLCRRDLMLLGCWSSRGWKRSHAAASQKAPQSRHQR